MVEVIRKVREIMDKNSNTLEGIHISQKKDLNNTKLETEQIVFGRMGLENKRKKYIDVTIEMLKKVQVSLISQYNLYEKAINELLELKKQVD